MFVSSVFVTVLAAALGALADGPREQCVGTWNVQQSGQTCETVSDGTGVTISWLLAHNPDLVCDGSDLPIGKRICISTYTPTCEAWETATQPTCATDPMLVKWNITKDTFVELNDNVDATSCALVLGQQYCVTTDWCAANKVECCKWFPNEAFCADL
ncbi:hypothetical protein EXIGLDRAFT_718964 [Exidia glandulosa HHB12029]|uniref:LysM domain-containing protein n=1 Tax=Exidia glandulosa HHB12029 TaxID=1314781 RepID=A0A165NTU1_EXIGL|nr:hypothetical protein EXIGLDRAFT_718964 [Exidia glandulosa HHB12029]